jgi:anti-anti-sigma factor
MWNFFSRAARWGSGSAATGHAVTPNPCLNTADIGEVEMIGGIAIVTLTVDELTMQDGVGKLADLLEGLVAAGVQNIVLDIQNVRFMDTACVACLVDSLNGIAQRASLGRPRPGSEHAGRITLVNPTSNVAHVFRLTRLDRVFPICSDVMAAVNAIERAAKSG